MTGPAGERRATLIGGTAVLMWGALALLTVWSGAVPPFQLIAMCFAIAFAATLIKWTMRGENPLMHLRHPAPVWLFGIGGLFGYHFFYFMALRDAPPIEAGLIAYLWPLLIVVFSALLPGERMRWFHLAGGLCPDLDGLFDYLAPFRPYTDRYRGLVLRRGGVTNEAIRERRQAIRKPGASSTTSFTSTTAKAFSRNG